MFILSLCCEVTSRQNLDTILALSQELASVLAQYQEVFATSDFDLGTFTAVEHEINTRDAYPIKQKIRRTPINFIGEEEAHLKKMVQAEVIEPSTSEWASPPVLIRKRDGTVRWCVGYRKLNNVTRKDVYPLPLVDECVDTLAGNIWFSKLDANSTYWQIKLKEEDKPKTAFITKYGLFQFTKMPFGLTNAPATFARAINLVLRGLTWKHVLAFLDDILVMGRDFKSHLRNLADVLSLFKKFGLKLKPRKCELFQKPVEFLGRKVGPEGLEMTPASIEHVQNWPVPTNVKQVQGFLGLVNYHRGFIKNFSDIAAPLYALTGQQGFHWDDGQQNAFDRLKHLLTTPPILALPNGQEPFILDCDASTVAVGAVLIQVQSGIERVISYANAALTKEQTRYCTTRRELLAGVKVTRHFRHYLLGRIFTVRTDHHSLTWLLSFKEPQGQLARWLEELSQYSMTIQHRPGVKHGNVDAMSRIPVRGPCFSYYSCCDPTQLPCGGCRYCLKAQQDWADFHGEVGDTIPLVVPTSNHITPQFVVCETGPKLVNAVDTAPHFEDKTNEETVEPQVNQIISSEMSKRVQDEMVAEQSKAPELVFLRNWLIHKTSPSEGELFLSPPEIKYFWINRDNFRLRDKMIIHHDTVSGRNQIVVPTSLKEEVMQLCHNLPSAGHQGIKRTKAKILENYFWHGITKDVSRFVQGCQLCNFSKKNHRHARCPLTQYHAGCPMERIHLDFLGPLKKSKQGNVYILVMVDQFTKWVECIALPNQTAELTAKTAVIEFFMRFGLPFQIHTDQGRNFESGLFRQICELLRIHKTRTTPYRPSANGQVERYNRTLANAIRCFVNKRQNDWDEWLPQLTSALRASINRQTGFTPNRLMLGRETVQPIHLFYPSANALVPQQPEEYLYRLEEAFREAYKSAREILNTGLKRAKRDYDMRLHLQSFKVGDPVYVLDSATLKGVCRKLSMPWKGPGVVTQVFTPYLFRVKFRSSSATLNHDRLKLCTDTVLPAWVLRLQRNL
ncbi:Pol polyprotein [Elysia marginata]|uniref:Pol polyprotein n=1 Tax=Elysia marginata TaxID=1093978 RepID=A0AAV4GAG9_9GAST|nr:Pol polyprotein [Elysia marginata]